MEYNLITNIKDCYITVPPLLYYSHIPTAAISLILGFFVFFKNRKMLLSKILLALSLVFSTWSVFDIILWVGHDSRSIMFFWAMWGILFYLIFSLVLYFNYVFIEKKDASLLKKIILGILFLPVIILTPTIRNLSGFEIVSCGALESKTLLYYVYFTSLIVFLWVIAYAFVSFRRNKESRRQIVFLTIGSASFLFLFFFVTFIASAENFAGGEVYGFTIEQYGFFGIIIFIAFLSYLIVRYQVFNIKLIATQALVAALVIIIGSELFFAENATNQILILITLAISLGFGYMLIKSVKLEVQRKEELQMMSDKLAQANDQLRKLDNAKTEFISIASHQLRTPLTAIKGFISMLLEGTYGKVSTKLQEVLNKIYVSNERLIELVENLLNISRIESGRMEYEFEDCQIGDVLKELNDTFIPVAKERKLYVNLNLPEIALPVLKLDKPKIREVISNLIDNALKYTKKGGVTVKAELADKVVRITVSDTGIGIPPEELPYLFSKFSRGKDTSRLHVGGTGLGLYVGKFMVEAHKGKIWAESEGAEKGSRFIIELPVG